FAVPFIKRDAFFAEQVPDVQQIEALMIRVEGTAFLHDAFTRHLASDLSQPARLQYVVPVDALQPPRNPHVGEIQSFIVLHKRQVAMAEGGSASSALASKVALRHSKAWPKAARSAISRITSATAAAAVRRAR